MNSAWRNGNRRLGGFASRRHDDPDRRADAETENRPAPLRATLGDAYKVLDEDEDFESDCFVDAPPGGMAEPADAFEAVPARQAAAMEPGSDAARSPAGQAARFAARSTTRSTDHSVARSAVQSAARFSDTDGPAASAERRGPSLKARAVGLLSRREYSRKELSGRLVPHAPDLETLTALLDDLQREGWLSDERYARSMLNQRSARQGERRIIGDLRRQGVADELLDTLSEDLRATEYERAVQVWRKRFDGKALPETPKEYARQARFLAARGFAGHVVGKVLKAALRGESEPEGFDGLEGFSD